MLPDSHDDFRDDFRNGFDPADRWLVPPRGALAAGDGVPTCTADGLTVVPTGVDPATGRPAFALTVGPDEPAGGRTDHIKWVALARRVAPTGFNGFEVPSTGALTCTATLSGQSLGSDRHPFGAAVADPDGDVRLATANLVTTDPESHLVFDFALANTAVYALYERVPTPGEGYASFSYAVPVAGRTPDRWHTCQLRLDRGGTRVTWLLDGDPVLSTDRIGYRAFDRKHLILDHGGTEEPVRPRQLVCGVGMFTMLDGAGPDGRGLVRLDSTPGCYRVPQTFVDERSLAASRLWGAGEVLRVREFEVRA